MVELLLAQGAKVDAANNYGLTPLIVACINNKIEIAKLLIREYYKKGIPIPAPLQNDPTFNAASRGFETESAPETKGVLPQDVTPHHLGCLNAGDAWADKMNDKLRREEVAKRARDEQLAQEKRGLNEKIKSISQQPRSRSV